MNRIQHREAVCYVSAIGFKLAALEQRSASEIADQLVILLGQDQISQKQMSQAQTSLSTFSEDFEEFEDCCDRLKPQTFRTIWQNFKIYALPPGWIYLELNPTGLAEWLQLLVNQTFLQNTPASIEVPLALSNSRNSTKIFEVLYTYARCAALLRLGHQANLIQLTPHPSVFGMAHRITIPSPLPWFTPEKPQWDFDSIDAELLAQIIDGWDVLTTGAAGDVTGTGELCWEQRWKAAYRLSQSFQRFYSHCRIFGEVATTTPALAQIRLGLGFITQMLLHDLVGSALPLAIEL